MEKFDIRKVCKTLYSAPCGEFSLIDAAPLNYFMIDGTGDPNHAPAHAEGVQALYAASYTLKFMSKADLQRDYTVPPLEGLWWAEDMDDFVTRRKDRWCWTMMIAVPDFVEKPMVEAAISKAMARKGLAALGQLRFERLAEGLAVQTLHVGAYDDEGPVLRQMHEQFMPLHSLVPSGHHHEIYLSDPRRIPASRLKTILRQPVMKP